MTLHSSCARNSPLNSQRDPIAPKSAVRPAGSITDMVHWDLYLQTARSPERGRIGRRREGRWDSSLRIEQVPSLLQLAVFRCLPLACSSSDAGGRIHDCEGVGKRKNVYRDHPSSLLLSRLHFEFQGLGASRDSVGDWHRRRASTGRYKEYSRDHRLLGRPNAPRFRPCIG